MEHNGFRALALLDDESVIAGLDEYVRTGAGEPRALLLAAWIPWRNAETFAVLQWAREFNKAHPEDPFRLFGLTPEAAKPSHYAMVSEFVASAAPDRLDELRLHYEPIITAHRLGEHIQRANGTHPGRPFVDHARDALALVETLPGIDRAPTVLTAARLIVRYHEFSTASGRRDFATEAEDAADRIADRLSLAATSQEFPATGYHLRSRFDIGYLSVAVAFHNGKVREDLEIPPPPLEFADAVLDLPQCEGYLLDLRTPPAGVVHRWLHDSSKLRLVIGTYDPADDANHYIAGAGVGDWFDILLRIRTITPTHKLDTP